MGRGCPGRTSWRTAAPRSWSTWMGREVAIEELYESVYYTTYCPCWPVSPSPPQGPVTRPVGPSAGGPAATSARSVSTSVLFTFKLRIMKVYNQYCMNHYQKFRTFLKIKLVKNIKNCYKRVDDPDVFPVTLPHIGVKINRERHTLTFMCAPRSRRESPTTFPTPPHIAVSSLWILCVFQWLRRCARRSATAAASAAVRGTAAMKSVRWDAQGLAMSTA